MVSSSTIDHVRNCLWSGSWLSIVVHSWQNDSPPIRFFALKRGEIRANNMATPEHYANHQALFLVWTDARKARNALIRLPLELTKTACKRSLVERGFRLPMAVLLRIGADAPTFRADFGSLLALITTSDDGWA
jgi:hypothetical protein